MTSEDVLTTYNKLTANNITIWIDGGWCVDALLGKQTREHPDLDIAIDRKDDARLKDLLIEWGYKDQPKDDSSEWNYAMTDDNGVIDVHVFEFDEQGTNIYGIEYPKDSLSGTGVIDDQKVNCISPEWMYKFKTGYAPQEKDIKDVQALSKKFGFELPNNYHGD